MNSIPPGLSASDQRTAQILESAVSTGDLTTVTTVLSQRANEPNLVPLDVTFEYRLDGMPYYLYLWPFALVFYEATHHMKALDVGSIEIFQAFLDHGWDINAPLAPNLCPPSYYAVMKEPLVRRFLSHGASPYASAPQNARNPICSACAKAPLSTVKLFDAYGASHLDTLLYAADSPTDGRLEVLKFLLDNGADVNAVKWAHYEVASEAYALLGLGTALHFAAKGGYADRAELLLIRGAEIDALDSNSQTPLELVREHNHADIVALLNRHSST